MIDIHSHILPGLDDGPETPEQALAMLRIAAGDGTTDIVATPHANSEFAFDPQRIASHIAELQAACGELPRIHSGCDFHLSVENIQDALDNPSRYTINHRGYLLVEFSDLLIPSASGAIFQRMLDAGITPIITHPERNELLQNGNGRLPEWLEIGVLVQVTAQSLLGRFGRRAKASAEDLLRRGMVHFIASDAHDTDDRPPLLAETHDHVRRHYGEDAARTLFETNPRAALNGGPVTRLPAARRKRWFSF